MNKKGFTLIELLAVIIILAIVALIATPIVLNVIDDAKQSAAVSETNMIIDGFAKYCETAKFKNDVPGVTEKVTLCTAGNLASNATIKAAAVSSSNATINTINYDGNKITQVEVISNGRICKISTENDATKGKVVCVKQ